MVGQLLRYRQWGEECVLFNNVTGDTHLLDICAVNLLLLLQHGEAAEHSLQDSLNSTLANRGGARGGVILGDLLAVLEDAFLVERCGS